FDVNLAYAQALYDNALQNAGGHRNDGVNDQFWTTFNDFIARHPELAGYGNGFAAGGIVGLQRMPSALSDTIPAMLTRGEGVVNLQGMAQLGAGGLAALNAGAPPVNTKGIEDRLDRLNASIAALPKILARAVRDAMLIG